MARGGVGKHRTAHLLMNEMIISRGEYGQADGRRLLKGYSIHSTQWRLQQYLNTDVAHALSDPAQLVLVVLCSSCDDDLSVCLSNPPSESAEGGSRSGG